MKDKSALQRNGNALNGVCCVSCVEYVDVALHMLSAAIDSKDMPQAADRAGTLKTISDDLGMVRIASLAATLERRARENSSLPDRPSLQEIVGEIREVLNLIEKNMNRQKN